MYHHDIHKLEALRPQENKGRGDSYVLCALHSHIDLVHADESLIVVKSGDLEVMIRREELDELIGEKYPTTSHHRLNLSGLLSLGVKGQRRPHPSGCG